MGWTNRHRIWGRKPRLVGIIRKRKGVRKGVMSSGMKRSNKKNCCFRVAQPTPTYVRLSDAFKQIRCAVDVSRSENDLCREVLHCSHRCFMCKQFQVTPGKEIQGIEVRGAWRPSNKSTTSTPPLSIRIVERFRPGYLGQNPTRLRSEDFRVFCKFIPYPKIGIFSRKVIADSM
ncbi:hypothetical protein TNCV_926601 [Trichonephila clavipes]|nr:hypothetical protein TNCV_926601 [Trichonephila clavipes]